MYLVQLGALPPNDILVMNNYLRWPSPEANEISPVVQS